MMFRLLFLLIGLIIFAGAVFYFAPDSIKEKGLSYVSESRIVPEKVKKAVEDFYATPAMKRANLVKELEQNLASIKSVVERNSPAPEPTVKLIERTQEIVDEIAQQKTEPSVIQKITETVTAKLLKSGELCDKK